MLLFRKAKGPVNGGMSAGDMWERDVARYKARYMGETGNILVHGEEYWIDVHHSQHGYSVRYGYGRECVDYITDIGSTFDFLERWVPVYDENYKLQWIPEELVKRPF